MSHYFELHIVLCALSCFRLSGECWSNSILELWKFDGDEIKALSNFEQVNEKIASTKTSPVFNFEFSPSDWLGHISYDSSGRILGAKAAKLLYVLKATSSNEFDVNVLVRASQQT